MAKTKGQRENKKKSQLKEKSIIGTLPFQTPTEKKGRFMGMSSKPMTGLSSGADESSVDCKKIPEKQDPASPSIALDSFSEGSFLKSEPDKFSFWFNKFLGLFLKEICSQGCVCSLPAMPEDEQPVDWLKLFLVVREKGGYNAVSESGLWDSVAAESGLGLNVASLVKLVYVKFLVSLERWLERFVQRDSESEPHYSDHLLEMGAELKKLLLESKKVVEFSLVEESIVAGSGRGEKCVYGEESMHIDSTKEFLDYEEMEKLLNDDDSKSVVVDSDGEKKCINVDEYVDTPSDFEKSAGNSSALEKMCNEDEAKSAIMEDSVECKKCSHGSNHVTLDSNDTKEKNSSHKRKRDSTWGMLDWVIEVAKCPCDPVISSIPESSKWKFSGSEEPWKQILLFREAAFRRKGDQSSSDQSKWKKSQKMHPCMYDDNTNIGYKLRERSSYTKKLNFGSLPSKGLDGPMTGTDKQLHGTCDSVTPGSVFDWDVVNPVPIGPHFQAEVPAWAGVASESGAKWLGTRFWPMEKKEQRFLIERDRIGKGRHDSCGCRSQGSVECVKFHVAEKRSKVKLELGSAFYKWKFDKMGEDVGSAWSKEEQKMFSSIVKSNPSSLQKCFWDEIRKHFRKKSREELVCYYYNVFLLQRRAYQNRVTPSNIDSDDEPEFESVGEGIRQEVTKPSTFLISPKKSQKKSRYSSK
ncbi:AT-rich interactive domain-containing protein 1-like [Hibiscus syriacus]|uniref:AT-rich interactive domain-containing protein 1-like n=1 Tax=Hibiscus syriacus TaxID=106335 RepID=UPI0019217D21|nr:AT-rich interactive domain-containing protein 1-like [Hibiscus syriacus]